jgi:hypothetical protein
VNPPVHAWAAWRVYKMTGPKDKRDRLFLERVFQKLLLNFTWWVNRKDVHGHHIFAGGFLGLDNIGVFDRSQPMPNGGRLEQADGTAWMAFYCSTMLAMALELAAGDPAYEDVASKFFEHFIAITDAINSLGGTGLWDEEDGFYYDRFHVGDQQIPVRLRSMVGLIPLFAVEVLDQEVIDRLPGFSKRLAWFLEHRQDLARHIACMSTQGGQEQGLPSPGDPRLASGWSACCATCWTRPSSSRRTGIRSMSRAYADEPYVLRMDGNEYRVGYVPGESNTHLFGSNSNWRGPIWFPVNYLLVEALERYGHFYGDNLKVECPTGSGKWMNLGEVATELETRLSRIFLPGEDGCSPWHGPEARFARDPHWRDHLLFHEYFHGDTGHGIGASHQTGWTALVIRCLEDRAREGRGRGRQRAA